MMKLKTKKTQTDADPDPDLKVQLEHSFILNMFDVAIGYFGKVHVG